MCLNTFLQGFRPDTIALLRELHSGMWRDWDWNESVGDIDKRPPMFDYAVEYPSALERSRSCAQFLRYAQSTHASPSPLPRCALDI